MTLKSSTQTTNCSAFGIIFISKVVKQLKLMSKQRTNNNQDHPKLKLGIQRTSVEEYLVAGC